MTLPATTHYIPQSYPLWAVRAASIDDTAAEIGLVIGWENAIETAVLHPIVATLGNSSSTWRGAAHDWRTEVVKADRPGDRWVEWVEIYPTLEQAQERAPSLFREVGQYHDLLWPQDATAASSPEESS